MMFKRLLKPVFNFEKNDLSPQQHKGTPTNTAASDRSKEIDILARTLWGEARGETLQGKEAVANVILNRLKHAQRKGRFWWGNSITEICQKPFQFSCWNTDDPNHKKLLSLSTSDAQFGICLRIAQRAVNGLLIDHSNGADHYHADYVSPKWAKPDAITATIGRHIFYKLEQS